ncbi:peptidyl-prolyl cis-trans isomerase FKBP43 isoform X2 [Gossypium raimondii]|uniref:peptidylprolyl isomerase n=1 Tax=Gossypium raimondii TaxID=29730 RepID=A0A0D2Q3Z5_GOSRA|nr:peptidyl-prolyl cis-trans isomerase FKBP43 isoform X2 [Gossypium raimondii]KJB14074.1 hypothetical protein B456_002G109600 [Gossypium raimondii]
MAFWGTEVKPGKPFTHAPLNGRLHLSQATLGMGDGIKKSIVQCNVGNKMPVFLCCLFPDKAECCQLNLEFEESDEVVFSVIGPRTVHLTANEEMADLKIPKGDKGRPKRRLRKKYRNSGSENGESSSQKDFTSGVAAMEVLESETEDKLPISSLSWGKCTSKSGKANVEEKSRKETDNRSDNEIEDNVTMLKGTNAVRGVEPECKSGNRNGGKQKHELRVGNALVPKKKREDLAKEEGLLEADHCMIEEVILEQNDQNKKLTSKKKCKYDNLLLASSQVDTEVGVKLKRKRKEQFEEKTLENNVNKEDETHKIGSNYTVTKDVDVEDRENQNQVNDNHSRKTKKKRRCKDEEGDAMKVEPPVLPAHEKKRSDVEMGAKNANDKEIQLSNGIIIEELEMGKPDGKIASLGKKVRVHYTGKLKESGQVFDSSVGRANLKFRLGGKKVQELWNVGLDGMRIGGKRRLIVPPSVSYTNEGTSENIPPNSWLVFDVELIKVK